MYLLLSLLAATFATTTLPGPAVPLDVSWEERQLRAWPSLFTEFSSIYRETQDLVLTHQFDSWTEAKKLTSNLARYTNEQLQQAADTYTSAAEKIEEFKEAMKQIVSSAGKFGDNVRHGEIDMEQFIQKLTIELNTVLDELKEEFSEPFPGEETPRQAQRAAMVSRALSKVEDTVVRVNALWGVSEETSKAQFNELEPHVKHVLLVTGQLVDERPMLIDTIIFAGASLLIPEAWLLRPLLGIFGFGPYGPVKGSAAAWAQRRFWGKAVKSGSWFSYLQAAGMKIELPGVCKMVVGSLGFGIELITAIRDWWN